MSQLLSYIWHDLFSIGFLSFFFFAMSSALMIFIVANPVFSILFLVFLFLIFSILLYFLGLYFFSLVYIIVYVGAIAILFLFVLMVLDLAVVGVALHRYTFFFYVSFVSELFYFLYFFIPDNNSLVNLGFYDRFWSNMHLHDSVVVASLRSYDHVLSLGLLLYTDGFYYVFFLGILLFVVLFGAILVVLNYEVSYHHDNVTRSYNKFVREFSEHVHMGLFSRKVKG